jgi:hypothetical protein
MVMFCEDLLLLLVKKLFEMYCSPESSDSLDYERKFYVGQNDK